MPYFSLASLRSWVVDYHVPRDSSIHECITKSYSHLNKRHPGLAKRVFSLYSEPRNKKRKLNIHLCGLCLSCKCKYISHRATHVREHIASKHPNLPISIIKIVEYPGSKQRTKYDFVHMTHAELQQKDPELAQRALDLYYEHNCMNRAHFCGLVLTGKCNYVSINVCRVHCHIEKIHPQVKQPVPIYKVTEYPPRPLWFCGDPEQCASLY